MVVKCGMVSHAVVGDANATIPTPEPMMMRNQYAAYGKATGSTSITFVSTFAYEHGIKEQLGLNKIVLPVRGHRTLTKKDMKHNNITPNITVDPQTYDVRVNGELITCEPLKELPMAQRYFLF